jgi:hypothetical protein
MTLLAVLHQPLTTALTASSRTRLIKAAHQALFAALTGMFAHDLVNAVWYYRQFAKLKMME